MNTSDLHRAVDTARIAFGELRIPIYEDRRLRECIHGLLNGMPVERIEIERARRVTNGTGAWTRHPASNCRGVKAAGVLMVIGGPPGSGKTRRATPAG